VELGWAGDDGLAGDEDECGDGVLDEPDDEAVDEDDEDDDAAVLFSEAAADGAWAAAAISKANGTTPPVTARRFHWLVDKRRLNFPLQVGSLRLGRPGA
jgi:hypothetical protein